MQLITEHNTSQYKFQGLNLQQFFSYHTHIKILRTIVMLLLPIFIKALYYILHIFKNN